MYVKMYQMFYYNLYYIYQLVVYPLQIDMYFLAIDYDLQME